VNLSSSTSNAKNTSNSKTPSKIHSIKLLSLLNNPQSLNPQIYQNQPKKRNQPGKSPRKGEAKKAATKRKKPIKVMTVENKTTATFPICAKTFSKINKRHADLSPTLAYKRYLSKSLTNSSEKYPPEVLCQ
jgi:hypothetical protein